MLSWPPHYNGDGDFVYIMPALTLRNDLLRKRLEQFTRMLHGLEDGDVRALHRTRVATRRLREVLPVLHLDAELTRKLSRRLRKVTAQLGSVRELDVLMLIIDELHESDRYDTGALNRVAAMVDKDRKAARTRLMAKLPMGELRRLGAKLESVAEKLESIEKASGRSQPTHRTWRWAADARVAHRAAGVGKALDAAGAVYLPDRIHDVRISLKKLRYALEVASEGGMAGAARDLRALKQEQDVLGRLHDLQMLIERARQAQAQLTPPNLIVWRALDALVDTIEDECRRLHGRYMHDREAISMLVLRLAGRARAVARRRVSA